MAILTKEPRKQVIDLTGPQGNAFYLLGLVSTLCRQFDLDDTTEQKITDDMKSGDYEHLITTFDKYFGYFIDLER